jgi:hypothetical protein
MTALAASTWSQTGPLMAAGGLALVAGALAVWRGTRTWVGLAVLVALLDLVYAWLIARGLQRHTDVTRLAMGAGLVAIIALLIRFGLGPVTSGLVTEERLPGDDDPS